MHFRAVEQKIPNLEADLATLLERLAVKQGDQDLKGIMATKTTNTEAK